MKQDKKEQGSRHKKELELNEKLYKSFLDNMNNLKGIIDESQQAHDQTNDPQLKEISIRTIKTAQKYLTELENKTTEVTKKYEDIKRKLELR
jgi:transcriptional accessory protein Tex/SPT6